MSLKKCYIPFYIILFTTYFTHNKAFAIVETKQATSISLTQEKRPQTGEKTRDPWANASILLGLFNPIVMLLLTGLTSSALILLLGVPLAIFGIIWGAKALKRIKREPNRLKGKDVAIIGIVLNSLYFVGLALLFYVFATSGG